MALSWNQQRGCTGYRLDLTGTNAGTLYGRGIYLAENATKSDEYGEGPKGPACSEEGEANGGRPPPGPPPELIRTSYILICRSALGRINYTDEAKPDADKLQRECLNGTFESVLGDRRKRHGTFREFIVYNDGQVYPEFIVTYERVFFHEKFAEIFMSMCARARQGKFKGPTKEEHTVLKSLWDVFSMPHRGKINKWQLLDLLKAINQPPENEEDDLDATFKVWNTNGDGNIDWDEFSREMNTRVQDYKDHY
eukprot:gnl/MRDRNA2_/MRDRNA2_23046_c0_seq1.p1 gnl/MRDRNA2_/MRDRNA2_23046_c0~~gnl/MRDRNA2_/MRDRNA2_23046_c0_seq1.p1  ORF type:complete len:279 (+),score=59.65 gnl/MRDRNA2_/MRDRNA2_23046_c0_seq1:84-839(+)